MATVPVTPAYREALLRSDHDLGFLLEQLTAALRAAPTGPARARLTEAIAEVAVIRRLLQSPEVQAG